MLNIPPPPPRPLLHRSITCNGRPDTSEVANARAAQEAVNRAYSQGKVSAGFAQKALNQISKKRNDVNVVNNWKLVFLLIEIMNQSPQSCRTQSLQGGFFDRRDPDSGAGSFPLRAQEVPVLAF